jgi:MFS family permease
VADELLVVDEEAARRSDRVTRSGSLGGREGARSRVRNALASVCGTVLEYYDFSLFGIYSAVIFSRIFFSAVDPVAATMRTFGLFALGFLIRPVGGMIFASLGDRIGRKVTLLATLFTMGCSTFLIGVLPSYGQIGLLAPLLLVLLRLLQSAGAGAELLTAVSFISEDGGSRKGLISSLPTIGAFMGSVLASSAVAVVSLLPKEEFLSWGWRLPFLASLLLVAVGLILRSRLRETAEFRQAIATHTVSRQPLRDSMRLDRGAILNVFIGVLGWSPFPLFFQVFALSYAQTELKLSTSVIASGLFISSFVAMPCLPMFGALSDRFGRKQVMIGGYVFLAAFIAGPFFLLSAWGAGRGYCLAMAIGFGVANSAVFAPQQAWLVETFDVRRRLSGMVAARESAVALGGLSPLILGTLLAAGGGSPRFLIAFLVASALIGATAVALSRPYTSRRAPMH